MICTTGDFFLAPQAKQILRLWRICWDHFGIIVGSLWGQIGVTWGHFWINFTYVLNDFQMNSKIASCRTAVGDRAAIGRRSGGSRCAVGGRPALGAPVHRRFRAGVPERPASGAPVPRRIARSVNNYLAWDSHQHQCVQCIAGCSKRAKTNSMGVLSGHVPSCTPCSTSYMNAFNALEDAFCF